jgi:hypothetical protein
VASGVESAPGRKDPRKLRLFIEAARGEESAAGAFDDGAVEPGARAGGAIDLTEDEVAGVTRPWDWQLDN